MQVIEGGDGGGQVALGVVQLLNIPRDLFDLSKTNEANSNHLCILKTVTKPTMTSLKTTIKSHS